MFDEQQGPGVPQGASEPGQGMAEHFFGSVVRNEGLPGGGSHQLRAQGEGRQELLAKAQEPVCHGSLPSRLLDLV